MPKRYNLNIKEIASFENVARAACLAGRGKRHDCRIRAFFADFEKSVNRISTGILKGQLPTGKFAKMQVWDPKPRLIYAAPFDDRVMHHALLQKAGPVMERALVAHSYACRRGKGPLQAVMQALKWCRRFDWYLKCDMRKYFDSIDHHCLKNLLWNKFKGGEACRLMEAIIDSYSTRPGKGLPIGTLTSQYWANYYLDGLDRFISEKLKPGAMLRYMDDVLLFADDKLTLLSHLELIKEFVQSDRKLNLKNNTQVNRSHFGVPICGYRVYPHGLMLNRRRKSRYAAIRSKWEKLYIQGRIGRMEIQNGYQSAYALTCHARAQSWRKNQLLKRPLPEILCGI